MVKTHAGDHGNELGDQLPKEAASSTENESYKKYRKAQWSGNYEGWNFNSGNYLFTTDTK